MLTSEQRSNLQYVFDYLPSNSQLLAHVAGIQDFFPLKRGGLVSYDQKADRWHITSAGLIRLGV